jgi:hypothetical protein
MTARKKLSALISDKEELIPLSELCKRLDGGPYCYHTVLMWCSKGKLRNVRDPASGRVMLERVKAGRGWASSMAAYWRFVAALNQEE